MIARLQATSIENNNEKQEQNITDIKTHSNMKKYIRNKIKSLFLKKGGVVSYYSIDDNLTALDLINSVKKEVDFLMSYDEAYNIFFLSKAMNKLEGNFAEVGCYQGGSSKLILSNLKADSSFYVFDTFEGLTNQITEGKDSKRFQAGQFACSLDKVKAYLSDKRVIYTKGIFPDSAKGLNPEKFSFVHLDLDLYQATLESLEYFYPKMVIGGTLVTHDYSTADGVRNAFNEFALKQNIAVIPLSGSQAMIIRV
jgi:O-methyltransferase